MGLLKRLIESFFDTQASDVAVSIERVVPVLGEIPRKGCSAIGIARDGRTVSCPYCEKVLGKPPGRKAKCPHCREFIYVRKRPLDDRRVLLREDQLETVREEWSIAYGTHDEYLKEAQKREATEEDLRERFGQEPAKGDVEWTLANKRRLEYGMTHLWERYYAETSHMARLLSGEGRFRKARYFYAEALYLNLNGPRNVGTSLGLRPFKPKEQGSIWEEQLDSTMEAVEKAHTSFSEFRELFLEHNRGVRENLESLVNCSLLTEGEAWNRLEGKLDRRTTGNGYLRHRHIRSYRQDIKELKAAGKLEEASVLLNDVINVMEEWLRPEKRQVDPKYYQQAAAIFRKLKDYQGEVDIVERYFRQQFPEDAATEKLRARLERARALLARK